MSTDRPRPADRRMPWLVREFLRVVAANLRPLAGGTPALLAFVAASALAAQAAMTPDDTRLSRYAREAPQRAESRDFETAEVCYERLIGELGPQPDLRFALANVLQAEGREAEAGSILRQLARVDRPGYAPAQLSLARTLWNSGDRSEITLRAVELHLRNASTGPTSVEADALLGGLYASTGRADQAETHLLRASTQRPELLLTLAQLAHQRGNDPLARRRAEQAVRVFRKRTEARLDHPEARLLWANGVLFQDDFPGAVSVLEQGLKLSANPLYHKALAQVYAAWDARQGRQGTTDGADRLSLLELGLKHDPGNVVLLDRLISILRGGDERADRVRSTLQGLLAEGKATAGTHFVLGLDANARGRYAEAHMHWEQADRLDPQMAVVANNLAWILAHAEPPDLTRALELANRALEKRPDEPKFRGTRGFILMKLRRWPEALTDLEAELAGNPIQKETHRASRTSMRNWARPRWPPGTARWPRAARNPRPRAKFPPPGRGRRPPLPYRPWRSSTTFRVRRGGDGRGGSR